MRLRLGMVFLVLGALMGCSTPYDLRKSKPSLSYVSTKSPEEVKKCILKKWSAHLPTVYEEKTNSGYLIRYSDSIPSNTIAVVTVEGDSPEVTVNYYDRTNRLKIHRLEDEVSSCK